MDFPRAWRPKRGYFTFSRDENRVKHIDTGRIVVTCLNAEWAHFIRDALEKEAEALGSYPALPK